MAALTSSALVTSQATNRTWGPSPAATWAPADRPGPGWRPGRRERGAARPCRGPGPMLRRSPGTWSRRSSYHESSGGLDEPDQVGIRGVVRTLARASREGQMYTGRVSRPGRLAGLLVALLAGLACPSATAAEVLETTLDNGLRVLLQEDHRSPVASFQIWYRVGSRDERVGATGLSHYLEHMMFKG